tara:strand:- start:3120 stop:5030 length:1911 start_codon:yes stop_codon:yes gene_type:complete
MATSATWFASIVTDRNTKMNPLKNSLGLAGSVLCLLAVGAGAADTFTPYTAENVPDNVNDLWKEVDARKDALETEVVKEWTEDGVVCRYVIFNVGTFKGEKSRIAAFYTFPEGAKYAPAAVWAHGGGQRAEVIRGKYFAQHGYAMVDLNWGGREILEGIEKNTDWGAVDPSQGPKFYPGAKRQGTKLSFLPDEHTIDPVLSPRNGNWFLLAYAGRRAITFLEQQPEVDPEKIGFTGYSMGGNITSYVSIDPRLKAVVPMVGGAGFITADSPGVPNSGMGRAFKDYVVLFAKTMESQSYYPHTKCPVLLLSASDDFHSRFEFIYQCMDALPHDDWRVSQNLHFSHSLGPEQWILINQWFDKYLKGEAIDIPKTAASELKVDAEHGSAVFAVTPDRGDEVAALDVYYSHDPNPKSRFWIHAAAERNGGTWTATLPVREKLPLFVFANCAYPLEEPIEAFQGVAKNFTLTSNEEVYFPEVIEADRLFAEAKPQPVFSDLAAEGFRDWGFRPSGGGMTTYKFRDPRASLPGPEARLKVAATVPRERLSFRFRITKNKYLTGVREPQASYAFTKNYSKAIPEEALLLAASDFKDGDKYAMKDWANISTFTFSIYDGAAKITLDFKDETHRDLISKLEWVTP